MTRINLVDPTLLSDKHLMAEYHELPRIFTELGKLHSQLKSSADVEKPDNYVLGKGHMKFFYNKLQWLMNRHDVIYRELRDRGFDLRFKIYAEVQHKAREVYNTERLLQITDWQPSVEEIYLNMARLCKRSKMPRVLEELNAA